MDKRHGSNVVVRVQRLSQVVQIDGSAPIIFDRDYLCPNPLADVSHASAEYTVDTNDDFVATFEKIDEACLHADRTRRGENECQGVLRLEAIPQSLANFVHYSQKCGIKVSYCRLRQCP